MLNTYIKVPDDLNTLLSLRNTKILFTGIGNVLKKDDGAGVYISSRIKTTDNISSLTAEISIENYIGKINTLNPDILVIIDCMDFKASPGTYKLFRTDTVMDMTFNTHNISLKRIGEFFSMPVFVLGIQPENVDFGENLSYIVEENAKMIIKLINNRR